MCWIVIDDKDDQDRRCFVHVYLGSFQERTAGRFAADLAVVGGGVILAKPYH